MTREGIEQLVDEWAARMRLTHWKIEFAWDRPTDDGTVAQVDREDTYDLVTMRFAPTYPAWTREYTEWTVVHELMHLVTRDLEQAADATHALLPATARQLAEARFLHELEGVVDRTASVLVTLWAPGRLFESLVGEA